MSAYIDQMFTAKSIARSGGVFRRQKKRVDGDPRLSPELLNTVDQRSWHLVATDDQYIVICRTGALEIFR